MNIRQQVINGYLRHGFTRAEAEGVFDEAAHLANISTIAATVTLETNCDQRTERGRAVHLLALQLISALVDTIADQTVDGIKTDGGIVADFTRKEGVND